MSCRLKTSNQTQVCDCCNINFTSIDSAMNCITHNQVKNTLIDERLFLFAFVRKGNLAYQKMGWQILNDQGIINIAKQNYLLIILNVTDIQNYKTQIPTKLHVIINRHNEELFLL